MAEEAEILTDRVERIDERLQQVAEEIDDFRDDVQQLGEVQHQQGERLARIEGLSEQMDHRLYNIEQNQRQLATSYEQGQRWVIGIMLGTWVTLTVLIMGLYFRG